MLYVLLSYTRMDKDMDYEEDNDDDDDEGFVVFYLSG